MPPKPKPAAKVATSPDGTPLVVPHEDVVAHFVGESRVLDADGEAHLRWLETGEGEPWPARRG